MKKNLFSCLMFALVATSCQRMSPQTEAPSPSVDSLYYTEPFRPQFHFSPETAWMNDPNGMVYYEGEYHLFYQFYPDSTVWGPMHWGHAVSRDMVTWEHLPVALKPDSLGYIFSGSAVVDWENTTGFGTTGNPPLVAIFTHHSDEGAKAGRVDFQYQSLAYSLDKGRNWTMYEGNPVLPNQGVIDFRDPKVFWHEANNQWVMVLAVKDHVELYGSKDLKEWTLLSEFGREAGSHGGVWECPDLFPLTTEAGETRWILLLSINPGGPNGGSATQYFIGDFDGATFTSELDSNETYWLDHGSDNYAGVTWSDVPDEDGRRLFIGWMSNWDYGQVVPTAPWRSAMTLPRKLLLAGDSGNWRVHSRPVEELSSLHSGNLIITRQIVNGISELAKLPDAGTALVTVEVVRTQGYQNFSLTLANRADQQVSISYNDTLKLFSVDRLGAGQSEFASGFAAIHTVPFSSPTDTIRLDLYVDRSSIEVFVNRGQLCMTELVFPTIPYSQLRVDTKGRPLLMSGNVTSLKGIWNP